MRPLSFFLRILRWFTVRQFRMHPWRVLAVLTGIALGAAVFTSVRLAVYASLDSFTRSMDLISGKADWTVIQPGGRVPDDLVARLRAHPAVETASPLITSYVSAGGRDAAPFILIGMDPILDYPLRHWRIDPHSGDRARLWLDLIRTPNALLLSPALARELALRPGDDAALEHVQQTAGFRLIGVLDQEGLALVEEGHVALTDIASMQEFTGLQGWVDRIDLRLKPAATPQEIQEVRTFLPAGITLEPPTETRETGRAMIRAYQINLSILSFVSLFVGMFLVYSLVSLNAASRRHELAILRSLGASSRLVFAMILFEGLLLGALGWILAIPVGSLLVRYLVEGVSGTVTNLFVRVRVEELRVDAWEILMSFLITLAVSFLAAYRPAREATRIAPREAMMILGSLPPRPRSSRNLTLLGLLHIVLAWPVAKIPGPPGLPFPGYLSVLILVVGFSMLSPPLLSWMGSSLPPLLRRAAGQPAFLAARYVRDGEHRTAISVGALVTATALFVALVIMVHSFRYTVTLWVNQTLAGDYFIRPKMAGFNRYRDPLPEKVVDAVKALEEVEILPYRHLELKRDKIPYQLEAVPFAPLLRHGQFLMIEGDIKKLRARLVAGRGVLVSEVFSNQTGLVVGDRFMALLGQVALDTPILGIFRDYRTRGGVVYTDLKSFQSLTGDLGWSGARFFFKDRNQDLKAAAERLRLAILASCGRDHPLDMASGTELRREILKIFDETFAVTTVLLLIALLVAGLGITTTLTVLVLERIRQLNTLSAVGASSRQIRSMIFWEALLMVTAGEALGLLCGFFMSHLIIFVINLQSFGWTFLYRVDWGALVLALPLILATALVAALPAARLVLRSSPALVLKEL